MDLVASQRAFVARPEKALLDLIYLHPGGDEPGYMEALRLQNLEQLDLEALHALAGYHEAQGAYEAALRDDINALVLRNRGAGPIALLDVVDQRVVREVRAGTGRIIDDPAQVGGWPRLADRRNAGRRTHPASASRSRGWAGP